MYFSFFYLTFECLPCVATVYCCFKFEEGDQTEISLTFPLIMHNSVMFTDGWESRWVESTHKGSEQGKFKHSAGKFYNDADKDKGTYLFLLTV